MELELCPYFIPIQSYEHFNFASGMTNHNTLVFGLIPFLLKISGLCLVSKKLVVFVQLYSFQLS